jgi:predicted PurR-regulated permease PerM
MADTDARPVGQDELVADIDRTRAQLARTIDAISDRVSPKKNVNRALEQVRHRVDEVGQRVNQQVAQIGQRVNQQAGQIGQRVNQQAGQVDPVVAGAAVAAVLVGVTVLFLVRRRKR